MNAQDTLMRTEWKTRIDTAIAKYHRCYRGDVNALMVRAIAAAYGVDFANVYDEHSESLALIQDIHWCVEHYCGLYPEASKPQARVLAALARCPFLGQPVLSFLNLFTGE